MASETFKIAFAEASVRDCSVLWYITLLNDGAMTGLGVLPVTKTATALRDMSREFQQSLENSTCALSSRHPFAAMTCPRCRDPYCYGSVVLQDMVQEAFGTVSDMVLKIKNPGPPTGGK